MMMMMTNSMKAPTTFVVCALLVLECIHSVVARENGTAQCNSGSAAVDDPNESYLTGTLSDAAAVFSVDGIDLSPGVVEEFRQIIGLPWSIEAFKFAFTGFLVRVQAAEENLFFSVPYAVLLEDDRRIDFTGIQKSAECEALPENVEGITHTTSDNKVFANGTINFAFPGNVTIDVTVIFTDENTTQELYAFDQFTLSIVEASDVPSLSPNVPSDVSSLPPMTVETDPPAAPFTSPPAGVMDKCIKMGKGMGKGTKGKKGMKGEMDKKGKKGEADDDSEGEEESGDERLLKTGGKATYDPCETEAPSEYPSAAPSAYPSAAPTASPTPEPTKGKGKGKMDKEGMKDMKAMGDKKGKGDKGGKGKGKGEETEAPTDEPTAAAPTDDEPAPEEPKGKGGKGKGGKGYTDEPTPAPTLEPTVADTPEPTGKGKGGKGGKGGKEGKGKAL